MYRMTADEAKAHLDELIDAALKGEEVVIADGERRAVRLIPAPQAAGGRGAKRQAGTARGLIVMAPDFDAPLADFDEYMR
jgi:antitoxin (DNA-binding transcriptional repressor) of toxin-antitoxin stability system